jgi:hypothetical protein
MFNYPKNWIVAKICRRKAGLNLVKFENLIRTNELASTANLSISFNMEIVCASLTGINKILKEINFDPKSPSFLTNEDLKFKKYV